MITFALLLTISLSPQVESLIKEGVQLRRERRDAEALVKFEEAFRLSGSSRALAQIALAEQALGGWLKAERHLLEALGHDEDPWIADNESALRAGLASIQQRLASVEVGASVAGATIIVNGRTVGTHPLAGPVRAVAGTIVVEVQADGYWPMVRRLSVAGGAVAREPFILVRRPIERAAARPQGPPAPVTDDVVVPVEPSSDLVPYAYTAAGLGAAASGVAVALLLVRNGHARDYIKCIDDLSADPGGCERFRDATASAETGMAVSFVAAGAFAVTSAVLFLLDDDEKAEPVAGLGVDHRGRVYCSIPF